MLTTRPIQTFSVHGHWEDYGKYGSCQIGADQFYGGNHWEATFKTGDVDISAWINGAIEKWARVNETGHAVVGGKGKAECENNLGGHTVIRWELHRSV
jgi:hypothetical protein